MFKLEKILQFQDDENLLLMTKRHILTIKPWLLLSLILIVSPFFFMFPLFGTGPAGVIVFVVFVAVGIFLAFRTLIVWDGTVLIITNLRAVFVEQEGIFHRTVTEISGNNIWDAKWEQKGILENIFNFGSLFITASNNISARYIPRPHEAHKVVNELIFQSRSERGRNTSGSERDRGALTRLQNRLQTMDEGELSKLEQTLKDTDRDITIKKLYQGEASLKEHATHADSESEASATEESSAPDGFRYVTPKDENL